MRDSYVTKEYTFSPVAELHGRQESSPEDRAVGENTQ
jgi:hypothetical protein